MNLKNELVSLFFFYTGQRVNGLRSRYKEVKEFYNKTNLEMLKTFIKYGFPRSIRFKKYLQKYWEERLENDDSIKQAYSDLSFLYSIRLMLCYNNSQNVSPYLLQTDENVKNKKILDYGCGVSDGGLSLSSLGSEVTIVDLDDKKLDFAISRYHNRNLDCNVIRIKDFGKLPELKQDYYDLVISTNIFEHIRNPLKLLKLLTNSLKIGGYLIDTGDGNFDYEVRGGHLEESIKIGNSKEYKDYFNKNYLRICKTLFMKVTYNPHF